MKRKVIRIFVSIFLFALLLDSLSAYDRNTATKVFRYLSKKWYYHDINGNKIRVRSLSMRASGGNYKVIANSKSLDIYSVYDNSGRNILDPTKHNMAPEKKIIGNEKGALRGITEAHNIYRRKTGGGLPGLVWDDAISDYAQKWADYLKRNNGCRMRHRGGRYRVKRYGENLAWASGKELDSDDVVKMWYDEIKYYNYRRNSCSGVCGHYTQVIWKNSKRVGCGISRCGRSEVWVCNYDPPGNYVGQKPY